MASKSEGISPLGLKIELKVPSHSAIQLISAIKPFLDGIIAAFHTHNGAFLDEVATRLSVAMDLAPNDFKELLMDHATAALGTINLLQPYRNFVKWNPADDRLVHVDKSVISRKRIFATPAQM